MLCFQTKNPNLGTFCSALEWKVLFICYGYLEYFTAIWYILWPFGNVVLIWYVFLRFGTYIVSRKIWQPWLDPNHDIMNAVNNLDALRDFCSAWTLTESLVCISFVQILTFVRIIIYVRIILTKVGCIPEGCGHRSWDLRTRLYT
jgi:hypothetical protein